MNDKTRETIQDGELAARLKYDITGGLGKHPKGTVLRNLSQSAFIGLTQGGGHEVVEPGKSVANPIDAAAAPKGDEAKG